MIDYLYAKNNFKKYKYDYEGYLVIIDEIRTKDILDSNDYEKMKKQYIYLKNKYKKEIELVKRNEPKRDDNVSSLNKKEQVKKELVSILNILPAITFVVLGQEKEIGILN